MVKPQATPHHLHITGVSKRYGQRQLISQVDMSCGTGQVVGLLGRNGSGKSTLLKIIFGSEEAECKQVTMDHRLLEKPFLQKQIAYLPQAGLLPGNYRLKTLVAAMIHSQEIRDQFWSHPRAEEHRNTKVRDLSFGIRRYCEVLLVLHLPAPFLLLDEPFSNVEPLIRNEIKALFRQYGGEKGIIATDHDFDTLLEVADATYLLQGGTSYPIKHRQDLINLHYLPPEQTSTGTRPRDQRFTADQQTLFDLGIASSDLSQGLFSLFEEPETKEGSRCLMQLLLAPLCDRQALEERSAAIAFFQENKGPLAVHRKRMDFISYYLDSGVAVGHGSTATSLLASLKNWHKASNDYYIKEKGITETYEWLRDLSSSYELLLKLEPPPAMASELISALGTINGTDIRTFLSRFERRPLSASIEQQDELLRNKAADAIRHLLHQFYRYEALQAVAQTATLLGFHRPKYLSGTLPQLDIKGLFHPLLDKPVANDFLLDSENVCFLTGANMSGKSTFLKATGIAVYFAHLGLPVPAKSMRLTLFDGLYTTINLSDNLALGLSHFYHEVTRVKQVGKQLQEGARLLVIFDEIFRGTNVRDARRASHEIISAFGDFRDSLFVISSHILEVAEDIKEDPQIQFRCFETELDGDTARYSHHLTAGVCRDSLGWNILQKEGVLELLRKSKEH
ncbi:MAG: ATP-binding cassette domain-containing protein [Bacteroidota bacterium]